MKIHLEVGKEYWHVVLYPTAIKVEVMEVKKYWFLQKVRLRPVNFREDQEYNVWSSVWGFSDDEFYSVE